MLRPGRCHQCAARGLSRGLSAFRWLGLAAWLCGPGAAHAGIVIQVNTTEDLIDNDGDCSLREAILAANANAITDGCGSGFWSGADSIRFSLGSGTPVIQIGSQLPDITEQVTIAGNTGGATRTEIRGPSNADGLTVLATASSSTLRHLVINGFARGVVVEAAFTTLIANYIGTDAAGSTAAPNGVGITVNGVQSVVIGGVNGVTPGGACTGDCNLISGNSSSGIQVSNGGTATIQGNRIGTDLSGASALGNGEGILVEHSSAVTFGGTAAAAGNVVSGNPNGGIVFQITAINPFGSTVQGNLVGTNASGTAAIPNGVGIKVDLNARTYALLIGGAPAGAPNLVSGNTGHGIELSNADRVWVYGNRIGTRLDAATPLPNGGSGVDVGSNTHLNIIGGIGAGEGNAIAFNAIGVRIGVNNYYNSVRGNSIHHNVGAGIVLADGQAGTAFQPSVTDVNPVVGATCPSCIVDVYSDGADEGEHYEGTTTADSLGNWSFAGPVAGPYVTVAGTTLTGSTSAFTAPLIAGGPQVPALAEPLRWLLAGLLCAAGALRLARARRRSS